jgi:hypothetical protein
MTLDSICRCFEALGFIFMAYKMAISEVKLYKNRFCPPQRAFSRIKNFDSSAKNLINIFIDAFCCRLMTGVLLTSRSFWTKMTRLAFSRSPMHATNNHITWNFHHFKALKLALTLLLHIFRKYLSSIVIAVLTFLDLRCKQVK